MKLSISLALALATVFGQRAFAQELRPAIEVPRDSESDSAPLDPREEAELEEAAEGIVRDENPESPAVKQPVSKEAPAPGFKENHGIITDSVKGVEKVGGGAVKGVEMLGGGAVKGVEKVGGGAVKGVEVLGRGAERVGQGAVRGAEALGSGALHGAEKLGRGIKNLGRGAHHPDSVSDRNVGSMSPPDNQASQATGQTGEQPQGWSQD